MWPTLPERLAPELNAVAAEIGLRDVAVLRRTGKTLLAAGELAGQRVVVKLLLGGQDFWKTKWRHEIDIYRTFAEYPPPVRVPRLVYTDGSRVLVLEQLDAHPLSAERYPGRQLVPREVELVLDTVSGLNAWKPPPGRLVRILDYPERVARYQAAGYLAETDRDDLLALLERCGDTWEVDHGDPLPSNLLLSANGDCALVDWEFTGLFLPGFDLAMLHTLIGAHTPTARNRIEQAVIDTGIEEPFTVNLAMVLTRELRIHNELPDSSLRAARLKLLHTAWAQARDRLQTVARRRS